MLGGLTIHSSFYGEWLGFHQRDGVRWVDGIHDVADTLRELRRGEVRFGDWVNSLRGVRADAVLSLRDPGPAAIEIGRVGSRVLRRSLSGRDEGEA